MSGHLFKLPPFAELVSSASGPTVLAPLSSPGSRYDQVDAERRTTTSTAGSAPSLLPALSMQHPISSPRLASSPPRTTTTTTTTTAANPGPQQHHQNQHAHRQHQQQQQQQPPPHPSRPHQHKTPNTSPAFPFTPLSHEFPSPAPSRTSHVRPIAATGQSSAVPERDIATSQCINQPWTASHPLMHATPPNNSMPYDHHDRPHYGYLARNADAADPPPNHPNPDVYPTKPLSPAPSPEHVSPLSAIPQRRTTSPQPRPRDSTSLRLTHRSRASSDPEPNTVFLHDLPTSQSFPKSNMPPPNPMKPTLSLEPSAEIDDASGNPNQIRCKSCNQVYEYTQPDPLAAQPESRHNMVDFTTRMLANLQRQIDAKNEKFLEWKNQHIVDPIDGDGPVSCAASMADGAARGSKRKAEVLLEDGSANSKLRKLSVDPPNASQLTPPPEPSSALGQASRPPLHARVLGI